MTDHFLDNADMTAVRSEPRRRLVWDDGRIVPRVGDLARVVENVPLEHGLLRRDQNVLIDHVAEGPPMYIGIRWRDGGGTHVMSLAAEKIEVVA